LLEGVAKMDQSELDSVLQVIENPVRRKIMKRLSQEPCYALQVSKELGIGQPLVAKHLTIMEDAGLVSSRTEKSPNGPKRKRYALTKRISITMDLAPNLFLERAVSFDSATEKQRPKQRVRLAKRVQDALGRTDEKEKLSLLSAILEEVDERVNETEKERLALLAVRDSAMKGAAEIAGRLDDLDKKRVFFHILDEHDREAGSISQSLNLRELAVKMILEEFERELF
jgi:predicted transcriptional regulator